MFNYYNTGVTVTLGEIVDSGVDIWDFEYPCPNRCRVYDGFEYIEIFDKESLQNKIVDHYRFRQIGQETVGRWLHYFRTRMREIMPYYCQLYEFEVKWRKIEDPLESYNLTETFMETTRDSGRQNTSGNNRSTSESSGSADKENRFSDTPQGSIENLDDYLTTATKDHEATTGNATVSGSDSSESSTENIGSVSRTMTRHGNIGVQPLGTEVKNIREAFINIDQMVIEELKDLFLQVY